MTLRPCFLVIDSEHASSISSRKLVLETAKYNVITAYSCHEALETLKRFPAVHAVVLNGGLRDPGLAAFLTALHAAPIKLVVVGEGLPGESPTPDAIVEGFAPPKLLEALQRLFPTESAALLRHEDELERSGQ